MIDKTMCEVLWRNISDFYVNLRVEVVAVSRNRYGVEKTVKSELFRHKTSHMVLSIIFLEEKHKILFHLSIFYEYQQCFQHRICFSIQPQLQLVNYDVEKTVDTHKILINAINFMFVFKKYDRQNHVWSFMTKYLRFICKFTSWSCGCIEKQIRCKYIAKITCEKVAVQTQINTCGCFPTSTRKFT
jgi:hypothetical protein